MQTADIVINSLYLLATGAGATLGAAAALKTLRAARGSNQTGSSSAETEIRKPKTGDTRSTECLALLPNGIIRLRNGSFVRGFWIETSNTMWSPSGEVDALYDNIGATLRAALPIGTGIQWRFTKHPDDDDYLAERRRELLKKDDVHPIAQSLRLDQLDYCEMLSANGYFHRSGETLWVTLPLKHRNQNSRNAITETVSKVRKNGLKGFAEGAQMRGIALRSVEEETELLKEAEEYFAEIQSTCPLKATPLTRDETWQALYYNYNENATSAPPAPSSPMIDLKYSLCTTEKIRANGNWFLMHGDTPATIITLFVPPESEEGKRRGCYAGMMRYLSENADLRGRYTTLTEFLTEEKAKTESELKTSKYFLRVFNQARPNSVISQVDKKKKRAHEQMDEIEEELLDDAQNLVKMRFRVIVYGDPAKTNEELEKSLKKLDQLCKSLIKTMRGRWRGADIALEDEIGLRELYETTLIGNMEMKGATGRELKEQSYSYCAFVPAETAWQGMNSPHSIKRTFMGKHYGINFWRNPLTKSPAVGILGVPGSGKSVEAATYIVDTLAEMPRARVKVVDFGETYAALCEVLEGRHLRLHPDEKRAINIWDYDELKDGEPPEEAQITLVVEDAIILAGFDESTDSGQMRSGILFKCVVEVYKDFVPRNKYGNGKKHEPTLIHLLEKLKHFPFQNPEEITQAAQLLSALERYEGHPLLDAVTHKDFKQDTPLEVYELDSLHLYPKSVRKALAFRVGSKVIRSIGEKVNGEYAPMLLVFDEMHEYNNPDQPELKVIFRALEKGGRKGRKTNVVTIFATHAFEDLADMPGITKSAGVFIVGKQDEINKLKETRKWSEETANAVLSVSSEPGSYSQFVINVGVGTNQKSELIVSDLSSKMLWAVTSDPNERNAREQVRRYFPEMSMEDVCDWLADRYPRGLAYAGLTEIEAIHFPAQLLRQPREIAPAADRADFNRYSSSAESFVQTNLQDEDNARRELQAALSEEDLDQILSTIS